MARKAAFTEQDVIDAAITLEQNNKTINGTNLRLTIGAGSPQKLMETYTNLLAHGKIKPKNLGQIEELEAQLEAQLEELARQEELNSLLVSKSKILVELLINNLDLVSDHLDPSYRPFEDLRNQLDTLMKQEGVNHTSFGQDRDLLNLSQLLWKHDYGFVANWTDDNEELLSLKKELIKVRYQKEFEPEKYSKEKELNLIEQISSADQALREKGKLSTLESEFGIK